LDAGVGYSVPYGSAVSTLMLVALGDKPARRTRTVTTSAGAQTPGTQRGANVPMRSAKPEVTPFALTSGRAQTAQVKQVQTSASVQPDLPRTVQVSAQSELAQVDADLASELIASGVTTQSVDTVIAVLSSHRNCASINAAAKASRINYRTAQRIVEAAGEYRQRGLAVVS
jgi:hypothetical protein